MSHHQLVRWGIALTFVMSLLSACAEATPTPVEILPVPTSPPTTTPLPPVVLRRGLVIPPTVTPWPAPTEPISPTPTGATLTLEPSATLPPPADRPFLMKIDRISVIAGRGALLQGRVSNGTLQGNAPVVILGTQNTLISANVLDILVSNIKRDHVTVGDYAGILVGGVEAKELSPGMLLAIADEFKTYEEALLQLR